MVTAEQLELLKSISRGSWHWPGKFVRLLPLQNFSFCPLYKLSVWVTGFHSPLPSFFFLQENQIKVGGFVDKTWHCTCKSFVLWDLLYHVWVRFSFFTSISKCCTWLANFLVPRPLISCYFLPVFFPLCSASLQLIKHLRFSLWGQKLGEGLGTEGDRCTS